MAAPELDAAFQRRVLDALDELVLLDRAEQDAALTRLSQADATLGAEVARLLTRDHGPAALATEPPLPGSFDEPEPPEHIGPYRLAQLIGRGGMGLVYRGEREQGGFDQKVAIKIVRGRRLSHAMLEQFALERRILARLQHPGITRLYDGGITPDGLSYIVMELVDGQPITTHAEEAKLGLKERVTLLRAVCDAVEHAHANGVVHADLKPANVLVDGHGTPRILDFGISGLLGPAMAGARRGSSGHYASPQQRGGAAPAIGDDVYALGVLMAELIGEAADGELRAIVARARADAVEARYPTVRALAEDLRRWSEGLPVSALPPSAWRDARFFVRRHRLGVAAGLAAVTFLVGAVVVISLLYLSAQAARRQAEQRFATVRRVANYLIEDETDALSRLPGTASLRADLADHARAYLASLGPAENQPELQADIARGHARLGAALTEPGLLSLGRVRDGERDLRKAESMLRALRAAHRADRGLALLLAQVLNAKASTLNRVDNREQAALATFREACGLAAGLLAGNPADTAARLAHADCLRGTVALLDYAGRYPPIPALVARAQADYSALDGHVDPVVLALSRSELLNGKADALWYMGDRAGALRLYPQARDLLEHAWSRRHDVRLLINLGITGFDYSSGLGELNRNEEALRAIEQAEKAIAPLAIFEDSPRAHHVEAMVELQHAVALGALGRHDEAIAVAEADMSHRLALARSSPDNYDYARTYLVGLRPVGDLYWEAGRRAQACATFRRAQAGWHRLAQRAGLHGFDAGNETKEVDARVARCSA